jgi:GDPmannose 4,6-dehydratase
MKTALITGILGQDAAYLSKFLIDKGYHVVGMYRHTTRPSFQNLDYLGVTKEIEFIQGDMTDQASLNHIVHLVKPDEIYNLASQSFVGGSWEYPESSSEINAMGVLYILEAMRHHAPKAHFYQASTSEMVGTGKKGEMQNEQTPFHPRSPYAIAKLYAHWMVDCYRTSYGLFCCSGILWNHESPLRGKEFVTRKITDAVAKIKLGKQKELFLGNIDSKRDWGFAGDYVEAMWMMLQEKEPQDFCIASGETHSIRDFLDEAFNAVGIKDWTPYVKLDAQFNRPNDVIYLRGDASKAKKILGWKAKTSFKQLVEMMVKADLKRNE